MILAAGLGTRLRPLTDTVPKPLIEVAGQPMIAFPLRLLDAAGIHAVVINLHHLGEQVRARLGDGSAYGVRIHYSEEHPILDTGGAIAAARSFLEGDTFVVLNADTYIEVSLSDIVAFHRHQAATATMLVRADPDAVRHDGIRLDNAGRVRRIFDQPYGTPPEQAPELPLRFMYAGILVLEPRVFDYVPAPVCSLTRDVLPRLLDGNEPVYGYVHEGYWRVLDTPDDLTAGQREIPVRLATLQDSS